MAERQRKVMLGTPTHDGKLDVFYVDALEQTTKLCGKLGIDSRWFAIAYDALIQNARNDIVAQAVYGDYDDLIFIDSDEGWRPEWVPQLLSYPVDCVGAAVPKKTDREELYNVRAQGGPTSFSRHPTAPILTATDMALGCGFLRLSRKALLALWDDAVPYKVGRANDKPSRWVFDIRVVGGELVGEDILLGDLLRSKGIQTWLDPNMTCSHIGPKIYTGDFAAYLQRRLTDVQGRIREQQQPS